jgi:hypothetical protein
MHFLLHISFTLSVYGVKNNLKGISILKKLGKENPFQMGCNKGEYASGTIHL